MNFCLNTSYRRFSKMMNLQFFPYNYETCNPKFITYSQIYSCTFVSLKALFFSRILSMFFLPLQKYSLNIIFLFSFSVYPILLISRKYIFLPNSLMSYLVKKENRKWFSKNISFYFGKDSLSYICVKIIDS